MGLDYLALFFLLVVQKRKTQLQQSVFTYNLWDVTKLLQKLEPAPRISVIDPDMTALAGSAAYSRFAQTIFWLHSHEPKTSKVKTACGVLDTVHNRTVHILKARNGRGSGMQFAADFVSENLTLNEFGLIKK